MELISSRLTFFYKYVFTMLWSGIFASATATIILSQTAPVAPRIIIPATWIVGSVLVWWACGRVKRVSFDGTTLNISNYVTEIAVPVREVSSVKQSLWINTRPMTVSFVNGTPFGRSIVFMPPLSFRQFGEDPIAERLRIAAGLSPGPTSAPEPGNKPS